MKRNFIIRNVILAIVILIVLIVGGYYIINENGKKYKIEEISEYNYFIVRENEKSGVIDRSGNIIVDAKYDDVKIPNPEQPVFICYNGEDTEVINEKKEKIYTKYSHIEPIKLNNVASALMNEKSVLIYGENGKYGIINLKGKKITKAIYDEIIGLPYKEGELLVKKDDKFGVINIKGNKIVPIEYENIVVDGYYTEEDKYKNAGYIVTKKSDDGYRKGYINNKGKEILKTDYNELERVINIEDKENLYLNCAKNGQYGINKNGKDIINHEYQSIFYEKANNVFKIEKSKKYGIANIDGKVIIPIQFEQIDITGNYIYAHNDQGITVYDNTGKEVKFDTNVAVINTENKKYKIKVNSKNGIKYGLIDNEGVQLIKEKYNYMSYLFDNYFVVSNEQAKLGVVNSKDKVLIELENDLLQKIENTNIIKSSKDKSKTITIYSRDMTKLCDIQDARIEVKENYVKIYNEVETKYFDKDGKELTNTEVYTNNKLFVAEEDGKYGYKNKQGEIVISPKYDKTTEFNEYGFAGIKKDGKWGAINEEGKEIIAPIYELKDEIEPEFLGKYYKVVYGFGEFYYTDKINK